MHWAKCGQWPSLWAFFTLLLLAGCAGSSSQDERDVDELATRSQALCGQPTLTRSGTGTIGSGSSVTFTASATCGSGESPEYQFVVLRQGASTPSYIRPYAPSGEFTWDTTGMASGTYRVSANVRVAGSIAISASAKLQVQVGNVCAGAGLSATPTGAAPGTLVTWTATSSCAAAAAEYRWLVLAPGASAFVEARTWGVGTYAWSTTGLSAGSYTWKVEARAVGNLVPDSSASRSYTLETRCAAGLSASATPTTTSVGTAVSVSASATCSVAGATSEYRFSYATAGSSQYTVFRSWSSTSTATWNTRGLAGGAYSLKIESRASGTSVAQATTLVSVTLSQPLCTSVTLSASPSSPRPLGTSIALSSAATCAAGSVPQYRFLARSQNATSDVVLSSWGPSSFSWNTTGVAPGTYTLTVEARASANDTPVSKSMAFTLGPVCSAVYASLSPTGTQPAGTRLAVSAIATCTSGSGAEYRFSARPAGTSASAWTVFRDWSSTSSATRDTTGASAGSYELLVEARAITQTNAQATRVLAHTVVAACPQGSVPDGVGGCTALSSCGESSFAAQGDLRGGLIPFANGVSLPAGQYTIEHLDGCMRYGSAVVWTVHAQPEGAAGWLVVGASTSDVKAVAPGTVGSTTLNGGFATYATCLEANASVASVTFDHAGGPLSLWLADASYGDNSAGATVPTFQLTRECPLASCTDGLHNGNESDVDCGGACAPCASGSECTVDSDCASGVCGGDFLCDNPACAPGLMDVRGDGSDCQAATQVVTGVFHSCARSGSGAVFCWGDNTYGQRGDMNRQNLLNGTFTGGTATVVEISGAGGASVYNSDLAVGCSASWTPQGTLCDEATTTHDPDASTKSNYNSGATWRTNGFGGAAVGIAVIDLGSQRSFDELRVFQMLGSDGRVTSVRLSTHAQTSSPPSATDAGWVPTTAGFNSVGPGSTSNANVTVTSPTVISFPAASSRYIRIEATNNGAYGWQGYIELRAIKLFGPASPTTDPTPQRIGASLVWSDIAAGRWHTCGIAGGKLYCWGLNGNMQLGAALPTTTWTPTAVATPFTDFQRVIASGSRTCAVRATGSVLCWGDGQFDGTTFGTARPWTSIFQVGEGGALHGIHDGVMYELNPGSGETPLSSGWSFASSASAGNERYVGCGARSGQGFCFGYNDYWQLGNNQVAYANAQAPAPILAPGSVTAMTVGARHTCAIIQGQLWCWGDGSYGQLGIAAAMVTVPTQVDGSTAWQSIASGDLHTCGIRAGAVHCWGYNQYGQTGASPMGAASPVIAPVRF